MNIYNSKRDFRLWFYTVSHSTLFIRSEKKIDIKSFHKDENYTIDIEFIGVDYIDFPTYTLSEISIKINTLNNKKIYEIESQGKVYHIEATNCIIGKSLWEYDEGKFINPLLDYKEIIISK